MIRWTLVSILCVAGALPAWAQDAEAQVKERGTDDAAAKRPEKESPIRRLAELRLDEHVVAARMINLPLPGKVKTVQDVLERLDEIEGDDRIGGVMLDVGILTLSIPDVAELRAAVERLRAKGKKVYAYLQLGTPNAYLLASAADEIAMAPPGFMTVPGLAALFPYMKGHFQLRGVEFEVITAGKYKYPGFMNRREPDEYFKEEFTAILDSWIKDYKSFIAKGRGLSPEAVDEVVDIALLSADDALQRGLIDTIAFYDDYMERVLRMERMKKARSKDRGMAEVNSLQDLFELINDSLRESEEARKAVGPKIAVLHARGPIVDVNLGAAFSSSLICRDDFAKVVDELRKNDSIKAVVMHVDSPGGSAYASDVIWTKLRELDAVKPLVVSMGRVAGSGGYYIACPGRRIFAHPTTITGSIGVLGVFQNAWSAFNRMDIELAPMTRGKRALLGSNHRDLSKEDQAFIQTFMNDIYDLFIERVAVTRKLPASEVRKIAEGRIWSGRDALQIGLVDELGVLADAVEAARKYANIPPSAELKLVHYPRPSSLGEIFESLSAVGVSQAMAALAMGANAAPHVPFEDQLMMFSNRVQPLCWMGLPEALWQERTPSPNLSLLRSAWLPPGTPAIALPVP